MTSTSTSTSTTPDRDDGDTGTEANKPGGGPAVPGIQPGKTKGVPDDGWVETGTSYGGLRSRPDELVPPSPQADDPTANPAKGPSRP